MLCSRAEGPQTLPVEMQLLRTGPLSGQAPVESTSIAIASCLPLSGSVRRIGGKGEGIDVDSRSLAVSVRYATQSFGQSIVLSDA